MPDNSPLPGRERLLELIDLMAGQPVLMLVDLVADRFITGTPARISREAPVLILRYESESLLPGGGANAVANVAGLGGRPLTLGVVGDDEGGRELLAALRGREVETAGILVRAGYRTPTKTRVLAGGRHAIKQQVVRFDIEETARLDAEETARFRRQLVAWHRLANVAVLSDYGHGAVVPELLTGIREALGREGRILCDSRHRLGEFTGLDGATPNEEEAEALLGEPLGETPEQLLANGAALRERLGARFLLITRGSSGMALAEPEGVCSIPVHGTDQVADVTGAGDTVIGTFALALAAGASPLEASLLADYAGGVVVMKAGTATLEREELRAAVGADPRPREGLRWARY